MKSGIYEIRHLETGKVYFGSSIHTVNRIRGHIKDLEIGKHHSKYLQRAFNKYGLNAFIFQVIEYCPKEQLLIREQYWMDYYQSYKSENGYNISPTAGNCLGVKHTEETRLKLKGRTPWNKGKKFGKQSAELVEKRVALLRGRKRSIDTCMKISNGRKGIIFSDDTKLKMSLSHLGVPMPEEKRQKISATLTGRKKSIDHVQKVIAATIGRKRSEESKEKMRLAWVRRKENSMQVLG